MFGLHPESGLPVGPSLPPTYSSDQDSTQRESHTAVLSVLNKSVYSGLIAVSLESVYK